jgi:hypothetical protein
MVFCHFRPSEITAPSAVQMQRETGERARARARAKARAREDEMTNCLRVTRFIMLAPIARNTLRSFRGVIHRGIIANAYCGSAEASELAARKFRDARDITWPSLFLAAPLPYLFILPPPPHSLFLVSISIFSSSLSSAGK